MALWLVQDMLEWERVMCPCQRAAGDITVAIAAVSRFDALSDTEPLKEFIHFATFNCKWF